MRRMLALVLCLILMLTSAFVLFSCDGETDPAPAETAEQTESQTTQPAETTKQTEAQTTQPVETAMQTEPQTTQPAETAIQTEAQTTQPVETAMQTEAQTTQPAETAKQTEDTFLQTEEPEIILPSFILPTDPVSTLPSHAPAGAILYTVNTRIAGELAGTTYQTPGYEGTSLVEAIPKLGYKFVCWSDGNPNPKRRGDRTDNPTVITALFDYDQKELPILLINTENEAPISSKETYVSTEISIIGAGKYNMTDDGAQIKGRGNSTWGYAKKPYKFKLSERENLLGIADGKYKDWILLANHCDQSLLRNHIGLSLYSVIDRVGWEPASTSVDVYLNGVYNGVYLLAEEIEEKANRVDIHTSNVQYEVDTGYLFKIDSYAGTPDFRIDGKSYAIKSDLASDPALAQAQRKFIGDYVNRCWQAVCSGNRQQIESLIDLDSLVDAYLYEEYLKNLDMGFDSFYMYKDAGGKMVFGPCWDFDLTFGNGDETCQYPEGLYCGILYADWLSNSWFHRMNRYSWFRALCTERWNEVYVLLDDEIPARVIGTANAYFEAFSRNFERYPIFGQRINRETVAITSLKTYEEHYTYLANWIRARGNWLNEYYNSEEYLKGEFLPLDPSEVTVAYGNDLAAKLEQERELLNGYIDMGSRISNTPGFQGEGSANLLDADPSKKYCLDIVSGQLVLTFSMDRARALTAYTLITANDTAQYVERNPFSWRIYGSNDGKNWTLLDQVEDGGGIQARNHIAYGYELDRGGTYRQLRLEVDHQGIFQMADLLLYGE